MRRLALLFTAFFAVNRLVGLVFVLQKLMMNKLLDGFEGKLNTSKGAKISKISADTALRDIQNLEEQGVLPLNSR